MTLRWRITILTAVMIAIASSVIGIAGFVTTSQAQLSAIDSTLTNALGQNPRRIFGLGREGMRGNRFSDVYSPVAVGLIDSDGQTVAVRNAGTDVDPEPFPVVPQDISLMRSSQVLTFTDQSSGAPFRIVTRPLGNGLLAVATMPLSENNSSLNQLLMTTIALVLGTTAIGALASWLIVRRFFAPVESMIATAGDIADGNLSERVPDSPPGTELGDLSTALNGMIASLTAAIAQVEDSESSLRQFVSDASHEIKTPLTVIRGYSEILRKESTSLSDRDARALSRINEESERLDRLVTALLVLDTQAHASASIQAIQLDQLILSHFSDLESIGHRPVEYDLEKITVDGNADSWAQLLSNIVQNILRHTPDDSAVSVMLRARGAPVPNEAEIIVDDCGPGIPENMRTEVFSRFSRLDPSRSTQTGGFGLGMSIIHAVVLAHAGKIALAESPCGGLRIRINIPLRSSNLSDVKA